MYSFDVGPAHCSDRLARCSDPFVRTFALVSLSLPYYKCLSSESPSQPSFHLSLSVHPKCHHHLGRALPLLPLLPRHRAPTPDCFLFRILVFPSSFLFPASHNARRIRCETIAVVVLSYCSVSAPTAIGTRPHDDEPTTPALHSRSGCLPACSPPPPLPPPPTSSPVSVHLERIMALRAGWRAMDGWRAAVGNKPPRHHYSIRPPPSSFDAFNYNLQRSQTALPRTVQMNSPSASLTLLFLGSTL